MKSPGIHYTISSARLRARGNSVLNWMRAQTYSRTAPEAAEGAGVALSTARNILARFCELVDRRECEVTGDMKVAYVYRETPSGCARYEKPAIYVPPRLWPHVSMKQWP